MIKIMHLTYSKKIIIQKFINVSLDDWDGWVPNKLIVFAKNNQYNSSALITFIMGKLRYDEYEMQFSIYFPIVFKFVKPNTIVTFPN